MVEKQKNGRGRDVSDSEIVALYASYSTKNKAYTLLVEKYQEQLYWLIRRLVVSHEDAQDILQEVFINVFRFLEGYAGESKLYTWLYRIAINECSKHFRNKRLSFSSYDEIDSTLINTLYSSESIDGEAVLIKFQEAILRLPEKQRLVFNLRYYDDLPYEEISKILDSSVGTLKTNYHYASEKIKEFMTKEV